MMPLGWVASTRPSAIGAEPSAGVYVVNPANPAAYQTIAAALAAGAAGSGAIMVEIAPGTYTENLTIPVGRRVTIASGSEDPYRAVLDGTITWNANAESLELRNVEPTGAISGAATGAADLLLRHAAVDSTITFTGSKVHIFSDGGGGFNDGYGGYLGGAVSTTGRIALLDTGVYAAVTSTDATPGNSAGVVLHGCQLQGSFALTTAGVGVRLSACDVASGTQTVVFSASAGTVTADQYTLAQLLAGGSTITNGIWGSRTIITAGLELTIAGGIVTATHSRHAIDTEADAASDDLDTINGTVDGQLLVVYASDSARTVVLKDGTGNLKLPGDVTLDNIEDVVMLINRGGTLYAIAPVSNSGA